MKMKVTQPKTRTFKPIPPFKSIDEEAAFWDSHSVVDDIDEGTFIGFHKANKTGTLTIRFDPTDLQKIREQALQRGVGPTTLVRMWAKEHLNSPQP